MPKLKQILDWRGYLLQFYKTWVHNLTSTLIAVGVTNASDKLGIAQGIGMNWKQAVGMFCSITFWEVVKYLNAKPLPDMVEVTEETTFIKKD